MPIDFEQSLIPDKYQFLILSCININFELPVEVFKYPDFEYLLILQFFSYTYSKRLP